MPDPAGKPELKPEREPGSFEGSRSVANAKRKERKRSGVVFLLLGLFAAFSFLSIAAKTGNDPSGALIFFLSAPLAVLGGICILVGIVMILSGLGSNDSRSLEQNAEAPDSNIEENKEVGEPDHTNVDLDARHFVKHAAREVVIRFVAVVVVLPLLFFLTFIFFGQQLFEVFFR